jgi:hypothetical protein
MTRPKICSCNHARHLFTRDAAAGSSSSSLLHHRQLPRAPGDSVPAPYTARPWFPSRARCYPNRRCPGSVVWSWGVLARVVLPPPPLSRRRELRYLIDTTAPALRASVCSSPILVDRGPGHRDCPRRERARASQPRRHVVFPVERKYLPISSNLPSNNNQQQQRRRYRLSLPFAPPFTPPPNPPPAPHPASRTAAFFLAVNAWRLQPFSPSRQPSTPPSDEVSVTVVTTYEGQPGRSMTPQYIYADASLSLTWASEGESLVPPYARERPHRLPPAPVAAAAATSHLPPRLRRPSSSNSRGENASVVLHSCNDHVPLTRLTRPSASDPPPSAARRSPPCPPPRPPRPPLCSP